MAEALCVPTRAQGLGPDSPGPSNGGETEARAQSRRRRAWRAAPSGAPARLARPPGPQPSREGAGAGTRPSREVFPAAALSRGEPGGPPGAPPAASCRAPGQASAAGSQALPPPPRPRPPPPSPGPPCACAPRPGSPGAGCSHGPPHGPAAAEGGRGLALATPPRAPALSRGRRTFASRMRPRAGRAGRVLGAHARGGGPAGMDARSRLPREGGGDAREGGFLGLHGPPSPGVGGREGGRGAPGFPISRLNAHQLSPREQRGVGCAVRWWPGLCAAGGLPLPAGVPGSRPVSPEGTRLAGAAGKAGDPAVPGTLRQGRLSAPSCPAPLLPQTPHLRPGCAYPGAMSPPWSRVSVPRRKLVAIARSVPWKVWTGRPDAGPG